MPYRPNMPTETETATLVSCFRKCCLCYFIEDDTRSKKGQIAHINKDPTDHRIENLVFLCFDHHDGYDSRTSQSKNYTAGEIREYKKRLLLTLNASNREHSTSLEESSSAKRGSVSSDLDLISQPWFAWYIQDQIPCLFAYKSPNGCDGICMIECIPINGNRVVVICEQIEMNPGMSITNAAEYIALQVCRQYELEPFGVVWIEHYDTNYARDDDWTLVEFEGRSSSSAFTNPSWTPMGNDDWLKLGLVVCSASEARRQNLTSRIQKIASRQ